MTLTMDEFTDLAPGSRVVVGAEVDTSFRKIDNDWFEAPSGGKVRARHFVGAIEAGKVQVYDEHLPRRWQVVHGSSFYSVLLTEGEEHDYGEWDCLTFHTTVPDRMYQPGIYRGLSAEQRGAVYDAPDQVPWEAFFKGLATHLESTTNTFDAQVAELRREIDRLQAAINELRDDKYRADALRTALRDFTA